MGLLINGPLLSSKQTKHIKAKFFLPKDKLEDGDVSFQSKDPKKLLVNMKFATLLGTI